MERQRWARKIVKKLTLLFLAACALFAISVVTTTMLTTATVTTTDAGEILGNVQCKLGSSALWALIIPAAFFVVLSTRGRKGEGPGPHR